MSKSKTTQNPKYKVLISKEFTNKQNANKDNAVEAIMFQIKKNIDLKSINYLNGMFIVNDEQEIELEKDISCVMKEIKYDTTSNEKRLISLSIEIFSNKQSIPKLINFIEKCSQEYRTFIQNDLGNNVYFFTQMNMNDPLKYKKGQHEPNVIFTKNKFTTFRNFKNVYFEKKDELVERIDFFLNNVNWYKRQGIAHTLGFMFYGKPGCGKTSSIKALANVMQRHIININLSEIKTNTQLKNLFYNSEIVVDDGKDNNGNQKQTILNIPINKRIYVFEDIDCAGEIVNKRTDHNSFTMNTLNNSSDNSDNEYQPSGTYFKNKIKRASNSIGLADESETDPITLSSLLNILDGTLEVPDRVIIITTNHPEKLDPALIRPGRIDVSVEFKYASNLTIRDMFESFFNEKMDTKIISSLPNEKISPATVNTILLKNFKNPSEAIKELTECKING